MLSNLKLLLGITDNSKDELLSLLIDIAKDTALRKMYPFAEDISDKLVPLKYEFWVVQAAKEMYQNMGNENVVRYSENGLSIEYKDLINGISNDLLNQLPSKVGLPQ